jgi:hypothetical protein
VTVSERHIVVIEENSDERMVVVENGEKSISVTGGANRIDISMTTAVGGGGSSNQIGGIPIAFEGLEPGDVLSYNGSVIANTRKVELTDGGNF